MSGDPILDRWSAQRGFTLIEVMVAAVVAVISVMGLAYMFSAGRGMIDRYAAARDALEAAQSRLDWLAMEAVKNPAAAELNIVRERRAGPWSGSTIPWTTWAATRIPTTTSEPPSRSTGDRAGFRITSACPARFWRRSGRP